MIKPRLLPPPSVGTTPRYSEALAREICERLCEGQTLRAICREAAMPRESTVRRWALEDCRGFAERYRRAREIGAYAMADELLEIADDTSQDWKDGRNGPTPDRESVQRSRLRVETKKWLISKILPHVFGDKVGIERRDVDPEELSDAELAEIAGLGTNPPDATSGGADIAEAEAGEE